LFRYVRNPVFSFMTLVWVSNAVAVPNVATAAGAAMLRTGEGWLYLAAVLDL
jgi:hypothetical protein